MMVFTIGYEGTSPREFLSKLRTAEVTTVVDVRELPLSRKHGFSKTALSEALAIAGIGYMHMRELGCPKEIRVRYRNDGDWTAYTSAFLRYLGTQKASVAELATLCGTTSVALLCYEADPAQCHRTYVAQAVVRAGGGRVAHIREGDNGIDAPNE
jgi:uncharacterized protein (DUF488 family)